MRLVGLVRSVLLLPCTKVTKSSSSSSLLLRISASSSFTTTGFYLALERGCGTVVSSRSSFWCNISITKTVLSIQVLISPFPVRWVSVLSRTYSVSTWLLCIDMLPLPNISHRKSTDSWHVPLPADWRSITRCTLRQSVDSCTFKSESASSHLSVSILCAGRCDTQCNRLLLTTSDPVPSASPPNWFPDPEWHQGRWQTSNSKDCFRLPYISKASHFGELVAVSLLRALCEVSHNDWFHAMAIIITRAAWNYTTQRVGWVSAHHRHVVSFLYVPTISFDLLRLRKHAGLCIDKIPTFV